MDAASLMLMNRLISLGSTSLLQYVSESSPWSTQRSHADVTTVISLAGEERAEVTRFSREMQKRRLSSAAKETYPSHFTTVNFVTLDYLLPKLVGEQEKAIAEIEAALHRIIDENVGRMAAGYLEMKRRHLHVLRELSAAKVSGGAA